jgi:hypothetical protein
MPVDCLRRKIWNNKKVKAWYAQNLLLFVHEQDIRRYLNITEKPTPRDQLSIVHPTIYLGVKSRPNYGSFRQAATALPGLLGRALKRRLARLTAR